QKGGCPSERRLCYEFAPIHGSPLIVAGADATVPAPGAAMFCAKVTPAPIWSEKAKPPPGAVPATACAPTNGIPRASSKQNANDLSSDKRCSMRAPDDCGVMRPRHEQADRNNQLK